MVTTCFKNAYERLRPINIQYRSYKNFNRDTFLSDLQDVPFEEALSLENSELAYEKFKMLYSEVVEKHAPIKHKVLRGNQAPFITRDLSKQIMIRSRLRNKFNKHKTTENWKAYKSQRNKCTSMRRNNIRKHFSTLSNDTGAPTKKFWDSVTPFLNDKGSHGNENYSLIEDGKLITDEGRVSEIFNDHYINIVENLTGEKQEGSHTGSLNDKSQNEREEILDNIIGKYRNHPSIVNIRSNLPIDIDRTMFHFSKAEPSDIIKIIKGLKSGTSVGIDKIPPKLVIMFAEVIANPLAKLINTTMLDDLIFPNIEKDASVTPVFKKEDRQIKTNYRPISVLNVFSKIFERFLLNQLLPFIDKMMSSLLSAYRSRYNTQHVLLRLIEQWRACLDDNKVVGGILMDLSKAFDCLPHDLLIAKLEAYGLGRSSLLLLLSYLKDRKQSVKIKGIRSLFQLIKSGVPQGSILGPILFNIFMNDLFYLLQNDLHNFADDNTISAVSQTISDLTHLLASKSNLAIDWFRWNCMIVNPDKFKAIVLTKARQDTSGISINLRDHCITSEESVSLLGITIDCRLSFDKHVSTLCRKAASQLSALKRLRPFIENEKTRRILVQAFVLSNFNYCPLVWYFTTANQLQKVEKIQQRALRFITDDYVSNYETLLRDTEMSTMRVRQMQNLCIEIYKTLSNLNPEYMHELFERNSHTYSTRRPNNLKIPRVNQTSFGSRSIRAEGAKLWNHLPENIKSSENLSIFQNLIKQWNGPSCGCNYCLFVNNSSSNI